MTAGELCAILRQLPPTMPVLLRIDREVTVTSAGNMRLDGCLNTSFYIADVDLSELFSLGKGWHTAAFLIADKET